MESQTASASLLFRCGQPLYLCVRAAWRLDLSSCATAEMCGDGVQSSIIAPSESIRSLSLFFANSAIRASMPTQRLVKPLTQSIWKSSSPSIAQ